MPTFLHSHWLASGLWYHVNRQESAERIFRYLASRLSELAASNLAWLVTTLHAAGVPTSHYLIGIAVERLAQQQSPDGRWPSEDGPDRDVHSTLEAMRALKLYGRF